MLRRTLHARVQLRYPANFNPEVAFGYNNVLKNVFTADQAATALVTEHPHVGESSFKKYTYGELQRDVIQVANAMHDMRTKIDEQNGAPVDYTSNLWQTPKPSSTSAFSQEQPKSMNDHGGYNNILLCKPGYEYVCALLASWVMNVMAVPVCHTHHFSTEMAHVFRDSKATTMCADQQLFNDSIPEGVFDSLLLHPLKKEEGGVHIVRGTDVASTGDAPFNVQSVVEVTHLLRSAEEKRLPGVMGQSVTVEYCDSVDFAAELKEKVRQENERRVVKDAKGLIIEEEEVNEVGASMKERVDTELVEGDSVVDVVLNDYLLRRVEGSIAPPTGEDDCLMIYTSGTTAKPKGVVHTHKSVSNQVSVLLHAWKWDTTDRILNVLPLHHVHGLVNVTLCSLAAGATCVFAPFAGAGHLCERLIRGDLTIFMGVPAIYSKIAHHAHEHFTKMDRKAFYQAMSSFRLLVSGSAALPVPLLETMKTLTGHTLLERYGMTEIGMALSQPYLPVEGRLPGTVGTPLPTVECAVVHTDEESEKAHESGSLMVRSDSLFDRYWANPDATARERYVHDDGAVYFKTGDTVAVTEKFVMIKGRETKVEAFSILGRSSVDIIKHNGYKLSALEIEAMLLSTDLVSECAVVGSADEAAGELVVAIVVPKKTGVDEEAFASEMKMAAKQIMAHYKCPSRYLVLDAPIPRNAMGKVNKKELKRSLRIE